MDSFKTGEFIKILRVEKGLTQKELAEALNCTDKAISRWETGKGFPDIVFLAPLAKTLGVTVNELLAGEKLSQEELVSKSDEVIIDTMQKAEEKMKKAQYIIFSIFCAFQAVTMYAVPILKSVNESFELTNIIFMINCICVGLLKTKLKFAYPLITVVMFLPAAFIWYWFDSFEALIWFAIFLLFGLVYICTTSFVKGAIIRIYRVWKKQHIAIKALTAVTLALALTLCAVWSIYNDDEMEIIVDVIEHTRNDETGIDELEYNGTKYYSAINYVGQNYNNFLDSGEFVPIHFPTDVYPYFLDETVDMSICTEYLPKLNEGKKYHIQKDYYFIYANDSITKPAIIYIFEDSSYNEWFISENFDFSMPTTETHDVADIILYEYYSGNPPIQITDEEKINEIITAKNNREDISKYVTKEEYGNWFYIYIRYEDSPFTERIGVLRDDGTFEYEETMQEHYEDNPHNYYVGK